MSANIITVHVTFEGQLPYRPATDTGEFLEALRISTATAKLNSLPFGTMDCSLGDLVEIDGDGEVIRVLERATRCRHISCPDVARDREDGAKHGKLRNYWRLFNIHAQFGADGVIALAVPTIIEDDLLWIMFCQCPVPCEMLSLVREPDPFEHVKPDGSATNPTVIRVNIHTATLMVDGHKATLAEYVSVPYEPFDPANGKPIGFVNDYWSTCPPLVFPDHLHMVWERTDGSLRKACICPPATEHEPSKWRNAYIDSLSLPQIFMTA